MENGNKNSIDKLLEATLSKGEKPSLVLNNNVKRELRKREGENKELSMWWLPSIGAVAISLIVSIVSYLFIATILIKAIIIFISLLTSMAVIMLTVIGLKYFELKEGAVLR